MSQLEVVDLSLVVPGRKLLHGVTFRADAGVCVALMGPSGSGKTSLLNCLSGITTPTSGTVRVGDVEVTRLGSSKRAEFRLQQVGMVFQFGELLPELTVVENVALPLRLVNVARADAEQRATQLLDRLGLQGRGSAHPNVLSGGETQRVGIARALVHTPRLVLADEPTGALDEANATQIGDLLVGTAKQLGATVVIATHDPLVAARADYVLRLRDGQVVPDAALDDYAEVRV
jgi:ABC-type lipoprotein export system ATPase subunit